MIGVVVWSNGSRHQAVIWCEDHGALAYLAGTEHLLDSEGWPAVGDMVELETETAGELRCARKVRHLNDASLARLPELLRKRCPEASAGAPHLTLVSSNPPSCAASSASPKRGAVAG